MKVKHLFNTGNIFKFIFLSGIVMLFAYCTTSPHQTASSFSKRKYTKGHFSDPVAKVKMEYSPYQDNAVAPSLSVQQKTTANNTGFTTPSKDVKATFNTSAKSTPANINNRENAITKNATGNTDNNASIQENSKTYEHGGGYDRSDHPANNPTNLLIYCIVCAILSVICFVLLYSLTTGSSYTAGGAGAEVGAGCLFTMFGILAFIAAVVFLILWIVAMARG